MAAMATRESRSQVVEFRALRGSRRSAVYRTHVVEAGSLNRIVQAAAQKRLAQLGQLRGVRPMQLEPPAARDLANELTRLRADAVLPDLDADLVALAEVANWCGRSRERASLRVSRR